MRLPYANREGLASTSCNAYNYVIAGIGKMNPSELTCKLENNLSRFETKAQL